MTATHAGAIVAMQKHTATGYSATWICNTCGTTGRTVVCVTEAAADHAARRAGDEHACSGRRVN